MQVFKVFFKIMKKNLALLSIYMVVFIAIAVSMTLFGSDTVNTNFTESRCKIAIINRCENSALIDGLVSFIGGRSDIVELEDDTQALQDALFFRKVEYILIVPEGFTEAFMSGGDAALQKTAVPESTAAIYMDVLIDKYLNTARVYADSINGISQTSLVERVSNDLTAETEVEVLSGTANEGTDSTTARFFSFSAYSILAILILGVSTFLLVINKTDLKRRNLCSPMSQSSINFQSLLANFLFAILVCAIILICAFAMFGGKLLSVNGLLWIINLFIFTLVALSLSFLLGSIIKNRNAQNAAANTISLGMSFLSGVFVPQYILSATVKKIASFTPVYWFVKANDEIGSAVTVSQSSMSLITNCYIIQLCFAACIIALTFILTKQRSSKTARS